MKDWLLTVGVPVVDYAFEFRWDWHSNLTYFCPQCNHAWAHAKEIEQPIRRNWHVITTLCPDHPWEGNLDYPGDLFLPFENEYNDAIAEFALPWINNLWARNAGGRITFTFRASTGTFTIHPAPLASSPQNLYHRRDGQREDPLPSDGPGHGPVR